MDRERPLRIVFVSTEVAPWSKVGGLADVLASLPVALAARGHTVLTVAPRYKPYPDTSSTGIKVPLELPPGCCPSPCAAPTTSDNNNNNEVPKEDTRQRRRRGRRRKEEDAGTVITTQEADVSETASEEVEAPDFPPEAELFSTRQNGVDRIFVDHPALRSESIYGGASSGGGGALTYLEAGQMSGLDLRYSILCQAALGAAALMPEMGIFEGSDSTSIDTLRDHDVVFVANDWPTALQLLRLQYIVRQSMHLMQSASTSTASGDIGAAEFRALLRSRLFNAATAMCIHNLAYQGIFAPQVFDQLCLPRHALPALNTLSDWKSVLLDYSTPQQPLEILPSSSNRPVECGCPPSEPCSCPGASSSAAAVPSADLDFNSLQLALPQPEQAQQQPVGDLNFMRAALLCADEVVTVSPSYAEEIQTQTDMGCGLQDILIAKGVTGIMNGIDTEEWNPKTDPFLPKSARYGTRTMVRGKSTAKAALQLNLGLDINPDAALVVFIGRLTEQKGLDVLLGAVPEVLAGAPAPAPHLTFTEASLRRSALTSSESGKLQIVMLGTGESWMEAALSALQLSYPGQAAGVTEFSEELAHWMLAAADYVIVPSRFEPCGLVAQCGARYGAVPIVTAVGGLKDLVQPDVGHTLPPLSSAGDPLARRADIRRMADMLRRAAREAGSESHRKMQRRCMRLELSWERPAAEWAQLLSRISQLRL